VTSSKTDTDGKTVQATSTRRNAGVRSTGGLISKAMIGLGMLVGAWGTVALVSAVQHFGRVIRFGIGSYIGSWNVGFGAFVAVQATLCLGLSWLLLRNRVRSDLVNRALWIAIAIALVLGIVASQT